MILYTKNNDMVEITHQVDVKAAINTGKYKAEPWETQKLAKPVKAKRTPKQYPKPTLPVEIDDKAKDFNFTTKKAKVEKPFGKQK